MNSLIKEHNKSVQVISRQLKLCFVRKKKVRIYHGSTTSTRTQEFKKDEMIDVSAFNKIIEINIHKQYAIVEPNVSMDQLFKATIQYYFVPPVVMEFPGITVGGGIQGIAGENSSFKWGFFHETCLEYEMVLGNGKIIVVSPKKNSDLFWGVAGSYGTLGVTTKIKIKIIPAKKYIKLTYFRVNSFAEGIELIKKKIKEPVGFIDGIFFSKAKGTVMAGTFADKENLPIARFQNATDDWFYTHTEKVTQKYKEYTELIPLKDYLFRHNRGTYWVGKYAFDKLKIPFNRFFRFLLNPLLNARTLMRLIQSINISQRHFLQDFILPEETTIKFLDYLHHRLEIYPLYLCPSITPVHNDKFSPAFIGKSRIVLDVGVWGHVGLEYSKFVKLNREVENEVKKLKGRKWLYAHQYYTRDEFWQIYDLKWYESMRKKYLAAEVFPDIYDKTQIKGKYIFSVWQGLWNVLKSPFKLPISLS